MKHIRDAVNLRDNLAGIYEKDLGSRSASGSEDVALSVEIAEALSQLSDDDREIVLLSASAGLTSSEIAGITGMNPGTVRSRLSRSMARMREFLT
jgi:RNA polymerase sigma factor (sigma-70 family)